MESQVLPLSLDQPAAVQLFVSELVASSYVVLADHGLQDQLLADARSLAHEFFARPLDEKLRVDIRGSRNHRGYVPQSERGDYDDEGGIRRYEAFDVGRDLNVDHPMVAANTPLLGPNEWPEIDRFAEVTRRTYEQFDYLTRRLLDMVRRGLDLPRGTFAQYRSQPLSQMRYLNYLERPANAGAHVAMGAHTDYEFITVISESSEVAGSLEVQDQSGQWVAIEIPVGAVVVLAGDLLETVTNGRIRSTYHRVADLAGPRLAMPFFAGADYSAVVRPAPNLVDPLVEPYAEVYAGAHLLKQLQRDFPYLRERYPLAEEIDLRDPNPWKSDFELRHGMAFTQ